MHRTFLAVDCIVAYATLLTDLSRPTAPLKSTVQIPSVHRLNLPIHISKVLSVRAEQPTQLTFPEFHAIFELMAVRARM
jgi:hypothetical protein